MGDHHPVDPQPDPRFLLANERTFLAWMRTSLAVGAAGLGIAGLAPDTDPPWVRSAIAVGLAVLALLLLRWAVHRYLAADRALRTGGDMPHLHGARFLALGLGLLIAISIVALLITVPG
jgi:putative membrane protein